MKPPMKSPSEEWARLYEEARREVLMGGADVSQWGQRTCALWARLVPWFAGWLRTRCRLHFHERSDLAHEAFQLLIQHSHHLAAWPVAFAYAMSTLRHLALREIERQGRMRSREAQLSALTEEPVDPRSLPLSAAEVDDLLQSAARKLKEDQLALLRAEIEAVLAGQRLDRKLLAKRLGVCLRTLNARLKALHSALRKLLSCLS